LFVPVVPQLYRFPQQYRRTFTCDTLLAARGGEILTCGTRQRDLAGDHCVEFIVALNLLCSPNQSRREILIRFDVLSPLLAPRGLLGHLHPMRGHGQSVPPWSWDCSSAAQK